MADKSATDPEPTPTPTPPLTRADVTATMVLTPGAVAPVVATTAAPAAPVKVDDILQTPAAVGDPSAPGGGRAPASSTDEEDLWTGRYSYRNFIGRLVLRGAITVAWLALAYYAWAYVDAPNTVLQMLAILGGLVVLALWLHIAVVIFRARMGHHYRLTTRRLFVSTGIFRHRRDQVELIKVKDVYIRQTSLIQRWLNVGTVVIESSEDSFPISYLLGVNDPKAVMDLVWRSTRKEREGTSVQVEHV